MRARTWLAAALLLALDAVPVRPRILRPVDGAALASGRIVAIATAPGGRLELDGVALSPEQSAPGVIRARVETGSGVHLLALVWPDGRLESRFFVGPNAPARFRSYREHPPGPVDCAQCHGVAAAGRWQFVGGCFDCHRRETFAQAHSHTADELQQCGSCHNAHGSTERALLEAPRAQVCSRCHAPR